MRKYIKNIKVGDKVKVFNINSGKNEYSTVTNTFSGISDHYFIVNEKTKVTGEHPYYVEGEWKKVKDLKVGDKLLHKNGTKVKVKSIKRIDEPLTIFNIEVAGEHNYYANGHLVHNKWGDYKGKDSRPKRMHGYINDAANLYNADVPAAADEALGNQANSAQEFANTLGVLDEFTSNESLQNVGINTATAESTGLMGTLFDAVTDGLKTKRDARLDAGAQYREAQKTISDTLEKSNLVTQETRMEFDQERALEGQMQQIQQESEETIAKAQQDFDKAKGEALGDLQVNMSQETSPLQDAIGASDTFLNERWRQIREGVSNIHKNADYKWKDITENEDTGVREYGSFKTNIVGGTDTVQPTAKPTYKEGTGAYIYNLPLGNNVNEFQDSIATFTEEAPSFSTGAQNIKKIIDAGDPELNDTLFKAWEGKDTARISAVHGPNANDVSKTAGSNNEVYIQTKCFDGNTWIEVSNG